MIVVTETRRALYFGCRDEPGHYLQEGNRTIWNPPAECPWTLALMDTGLLKNGRHPDCLPVKELANLARALVCEVIRADLA